MVGQAVLRECLLDPEVERVLAVVRAPTGQTHPKLRELVHGDFFDFGPLAGELTGYDACCFCLGVSSAGLKEADYHHLTYDLTLAAATTLARLNPGITFIYVSGAGTDSSERGRSMWARVKGKTENALLRLPFRGAFMFRPGFIQPLHGVRSRTRWYRVLYVLMTPLLPLLRLFFAAQMTTSERLGRAMLHVAKHGAERGLPPIVESRDIEALAAQAAAGA
jgi:uncharacterized protein YbjT (DUF2867 family)